MKIKHYGWVRDLPDQRDLLKLETPQVVPDNVDLRPLMPPVYNQGNLGSCTANAIAGALEYQDMVEDKIKGFTPSRLFIYYNERVMEGTIGSDAGASIRDGIKSVNKLGVPPETIWTYKVSRFTVKPSTIAYKQALGFKSLIYTRLDHANLNLLQQSLATGFPFVFGISVYESFDSSVNGLIPIPQKSEQLLGGHALLAVGYDNLKKVFIVRNSWGGSWGDKGYCYIPYAYLTGKLASDFWNIEKVI